MKTKILSLILVIAFVLSACAGGSELQQNQSKWERQGSDHYRITIIVTCFCVFAGTEVTYEVQNSQVIDQTVQFRPDNPGDEAQVLEFYEPYSTIDKVFGFVENAIAEADETTVEYDSTYGFPSNVTVDWIKEAADDEIYLTISNFEALP